MSDEVKNDGIVDNSNLDAGIAARTVEPKPEPEAKPEATAAPEVEANEEGEGSGEQNDAEGSATSDNDAPRKNRGVGKRIDELTQARREAERERDHWREMAMKGQTQQPPQAKAEEPTGEPTLESCDFDNEVYVRKWYAWSRENERKAEKARQEQEQKAERIRQFQAKEAEFAARTPDYRDVAYGNVPITEQMAELIIEADDPPAVAYYLGKNVEEAAKIASMNATQAARAIGRIEAKLSSPAPAMSAPPQKPVSSAPPPVTTLTGAPAINKSYEDMSQDEYERARRKEREAKGLKP